MKLAVLQSNYLPWRGYFDLIHDVDLFLFYDEVQYTKNDWRNRNLIRTRNGREWITVPVHGALDKRIDEVQIVQDRWQMKHYQAILTNYRKAPYFAQYHVFLEDVYLNHSWESLSALNQFLIQTIAYDFLGIQTVFGQSTDYVSEGAGHEKLLSLVKKTGADCYLSGPAAQSYLVERDYADAGIQVLWKDYHGYPEYSQRFSPFEPAVSILDLLFNTGASAPDLIWGWRAA